MEMKEKKRVLVKHVSGWICYICIVVNYLCSE